jgi:hypothetical protein
MTDSFAPDHQLIADETEYWPGGSKWPGSHSSLVLFTEVGHDCSQREDGTYHNWSAYLGCGVLSNIPGFAEQSGIPDAMSELPGFELSKIDMLEELQKHLRECKKNMVSEKSVKQGQSAIAQLIRLTKSACPDATIYFCEDE